MRLRCTLSSCATGAAVVAAAAPVDCCAIRLGDVHNCVEGARAVAFLDWPSAMELGSMVSI